MGAGARLPAGVPRRSFTFLGGFALPMLLGTLKTRAGARPSTTAIAARPPIPREP